MYLGIVGLALFSMTSLLLHNTYKYEGIIITIAFCLFLIETIANVFIAKHKPQIVNSLFNIIFKIALLAIVMFSIVIE
ncbi:hypothetical protein FD06_GL000792 [Apilactobacillus ozensis DSM 23829 = JCM 17196]|uniref:Uncharacterized protein n=1 Tax=Apilactobacillus ozensis DSM 23829 = JCM 17196 TaxID=1423781 RepID=A0A0R2AK47_9LACO|nr:hypothetical protein FD06_GL000792 [Apilactobacillus ozensis DSM 23829 = JCM 17196]